ncbi:MAG: metallophosphoesterase [Candidatus Obscuribacterales bacterium]|nr:metallophosphoesterase [Candidatus Obscuribacterales bacterium]
MPLKLECGNKRNMIFAGLASLGALAAGTYWYASRVEARRFKLEVVNVITGAGHEPLAEAEAVAGRHPLSLRVLHLSDLHLSKPESVKIDFVRRVTDDDFDLILFTGDIFENYSGIEYASQLISRQPRLGSYAVLGNHDYYNYTMFHRTLGRLHKKFRYPKEYRDVEPMVEALENAGITVLRNTSKSHEEEKVHIVGVDYPGISDADLKKLVQSAPKNHAILLLFHVPKNLKRYAELGVHMAFGGHTHGGQVRVPGVGALITDSELPRHEASGLLWRGNTAIHISRGLGADPRTNFRLFCPPHASIINIKHYS